jgi:hypothetical protein
LIVAAPPARPVLAAAQGFNDLAAESHAAGKGEKMQTRPAGEAIAPRVWRDLAGLAAEAVAIGVLFSVLLALAVLVMTRGRPDDSFAGATEPIAPALIAAASR